MKSCPSCRTTVMAGSLYCAECGTQLSDIQKASTQSFEWNDILKTDTINFPLPLQTADTGAGAGIAIHVVDADHLIMLEGREEFTIGRSAEGQPILPDIDLSKYEAYEKGVSRLHVSVRTKGQKITITDLGSVNGTRLNGIKILPKQAYPLKHGDILTLGKLKVQVIAQGKI